MREIFFIGFVISVHYRPAEMSPLSHCLLISGYSKGVCAAGASLSRYASSSSLLYFVRMAGIKYYVFNNDVGLRLLLYTKC